MDEKRYLVYEIANLELLEIVVGISGTPVDEVRLSDPELEPERWDPSHRVVRRVVEAGLTLDEAAAFALTYCETTALSPMTVYLAGVPSHA